jgi:hypothetical protein
VNPNQPPATSSGRSLSFALSDVIVAGAAFLFFVFSFTPIVSVSIGSVGGININVPSATRNLWQFDSPLGWWTAIANLLVLATAVASLWWPRDKQYVGFGRNQVQLVIALFVFIEIIGSLIALGSIFGWGGYLMFVCSIAALGGAVLGHIGMLQNEIAVPGVGGSGSQATPPPAAYAPPASYEPPSGGYQPPASYQPPQQTVEQPRQDSVG